MFFFQNPFDNGKFTSVCQFVVVHNHDIHNCEDLMHLYINEVINKITSILMSISLPIYNSWYPDAIINWVYSDCPDMRPVWSLDSA